jgi:hypothetical protein
MVIPSYINEQTPDQLLQEEIIHRLVNDDLPQLVKNKSTSYIAVKAPA